MFVSFNGQWLIVRRVEVISLFNFCWIGGRRVSVILLSLPLISCYTIFSAQVTFRKVPCQTRELSWRGWYYPHFRISFKLPFYMAEARATILRGLSLVAGYRTFTHLIHVCLTQTIIYGFNLCYQTHVVISLHRPSFCITGPRQFSTVSVIFPLGVNLPPPIIVC